MENFPSNIRALAAPIRDMLFFFPNNRDMLFHAWHHGGSKIWVLLFCLAGRFFFMFASPIDRLLDLVSTPLWSGTLDVLIACS